MWKPGDEDGQATLTDPRFRADVLAGLEQRPRAIPARWLYDARGSDLFEQITDLPEYYPTRTEVALLKRLCPELPAIIGDGRAVVEFGSGSSTKTPLLLDCIAPSAYVPIDISGDALRAASRRMSERFSDLLILPFEADFTRPLTLPRTIETAPKLGFFPGSTIGNLQPVGAVDLLRAMRASLGEGAMLLIGMDRIKGEEVLIPAYDDAAGVTAAFNLNLLERINRELDGTVPVDDFRHQARWNDAEGRVEMHLEATRDVQFVVAGRDVAMAGGRVFIRRTVINTVLVMRGCCCARAGGPR